MEAIEGEDVPADRYLAIYLNDHLAGAIAGSDRARRAASNNAGTSFGSFLSQLSTDIEEDREALENLMSELGVQKNLLKDAAAWVGEKVGRLKLNGRLGEYSDLSRLVDLEILSLGVEGKLAMWRNLTQVQGKYPALAGIDLNRLIERAEAQRQGLESLRQEAAGKAL